MAKNGSKLEKRLPRGKPGRHGGYSFLTRGTLPENRPHILRYLTAVREGLIKDLGPTEDNLTTAQIVLIDRVVTKLGVIRCIEEYIRENTVMNGARLSPSLRESYLAYNNSIRLDLAALGINKKQTRAFDLKTYVRETYGVKEAEAGSKEGAGGPERPQEGRSQRKQ